MATQLLIDTDVLIDYLRDYSTYRLQSKAVSIAATTES
jgi:hypothetical protein